MARQKYTSMMSRGSKDLSQVYVVQRVQRRHLGLGLEYEESTGETKFIPAIVPVAEIKTEVPKQKVL